MPTFKKTKKGKTVEMVEPINEKNIQQFVEEFGQDYARIYFIALSEFTASLKDCIQDKQFFETQIRRTPNICRKLTTEFFHHNQNLLELSEKILKPISILEIKP